MSAEDTHMNPISPEILNILTQLRTELADLRQTNEDLQEELRLARSHPPVPPSLIPYY